ncbi:MAG: HEAT repeat domain-containing protein [Polyangiaceae bacterium]
MSDTHGDRRQTLQLLARLRDASTSEDELSEIAEALSDAEDPRVVQPLRELLEDRARPRALREVAGQVLGAVDYDAGETTLLRWWHSGDTVLQEHALGLMDDQQGKDVLLSIARDPRHALHTLAIRGLSHGFWQPEYQRTRIAALSHPEAEVRRAATDALVFDEPIAAEPALLRCLEDSDSSVMDGAAATLEYYPSVAVVKALAARIRRGPPGFDEELAELEELHWQSVLDAFAALKRDLREHLVQAEPAVRAELLEWLDPAWTELAYTAQELEPEPVERGEPMPKGPRRAMDHWELEGILRDPAAPTSLLNGLSDVDVLAFSDVQRASLFDLLERSEDPERLDLLARFCGETCDATRLLRLLEGARFGVRKSAMYHLGRLPPDPKLALLIAEYWKRPDVRGTHGYETLEAYVHHAPAADARRKALSVAADSARDPHSRFHAIYALEKLGATAELTRLLPLLAEPPLVNWALHNALLDAATKRNLEVSAATLEPLGSVDNLHLREALARYRHRAALM